MEDEDESGPNEDDDTAEIDGEAVWGNEDWNRVERWCRLDEDIDAAHQRLAIKTTIDEEHKFYADSHRLLLRLLKNVEEAHRIRIPESLSEWCNPLGLQRCIFTQVSP